MSNKPYDIAVILGRFQPLHNGHINLIEQSFSLADKVFIMIGHSGFEDIRHFMSPEEVENSIEETFCTKNNMYHIEHIMDMHDDGKWVLKLSNKIEIMKAKHLPWIKGSANICFLGSKKDINWYANLLPNWTLITLPPYKNINATAIRGDFFCNKRISQEIPEESDMFMKEYVDSERYEKLAKRYKQYYSIID